MAQASEKPSGDIGASQFRHSLDHPYGLPKVKGEVFITRDDQEMALVGKKQQLRVRHPFIHRSGTNRHGQRNFGFMSIVGLSCTIMVTWEGLLWSDHLHFHLVSVLNNAVSLRTVSETVAQLD